MPPLEQGRIVWAWMVDSAGRDRKRRPAVILTSTEELANDVPFVAVAATTQFPDPLPADHVLLPWHPEGRVRTKLPRPTAAVCSWLVQLHLEDIDQWGGVVPPSHMLEIVRKVNSLFEQQSG